MRTAKAQDHRCPLTESLDTAKCINGEKTPGWDFAHAWDESKYVNFAHVWISLIYYLLMCLKQCRIIGSVGTDQAPLSKASDLSQHCLLRPVCPYT